MDDYKEILFTGLSSNRESAIVSVEKALLKHGNWGSQGNFSRPISEIQSEWVIKITERKNGYEVSFNGPNRSYQYEIRFFVDRKELSISDKDVTIAYEAPPPL